MGWGTKLGLGVMALAPIGFLTVGAIDAFDAVRFNAVAVETDAKIERIIQGPSSKTGGTGGKPSDTVQGSFFPELTFVTETGETVTALSSSSTSSEFAYPMKAGDTVTARYDPGDVTDVRLWTPMQMFIGPVFFLIFGVVFGGMISIAWVLFARK